MQHSVLDAGDGKKEKNSDNLHAVGKGGENAQQKYFVANKRSEFKGRKTFLANCIACY